MSEMSSLVLSSATPSSAQDGFFFGNLRRRPRLGSARNHQLRHNLIKPLVHFCLLHVISSIEMYDIQSQDHYPSHLGAHLQVELRLVSRRSSDTQPRADTCSRRNRRGFERGGMPDFGTGQWGAVGEAGIVGRGSSTVS